jgi:hypothetical protein
VFLCVIAAVKSRMFENLSNCYALLQSACVGGHESVLDYCLNLLPTLAASRTLLEEYIQTELVPVCLLCKFSYLHIYLLTKKKLSF